MHLNYVTVDASATFEEVARRVRRHEGRTGRIPTVFVTADEELLGELPGGTLAMTDVGAVALTEYVVDVPAVRYDSPIRRSSTDTIRKKSVSRNWGRNRYALFLRAFDLFHDLVGVDVGIFERRFDVFAACTAAHHAAHATHHTAHAAAEFFLDDDAVDAQNFG